jgi:hypothetical protein
VIEYLGRYTHRVAISNQRLVAFQDGQVSFCRKDYRHADKQQVTAVSAEEFIRRFLLHALPPVSSASATLACWPTVTARKRRSFAANNWQFPRRP